MRGHHRRQRQGQRVRLVQVEPHRRAQHRLGRLLGLVDEPVAQADGRQVAERGRRGRLVAHLGREVAGLPELLGSAVRVVLEVREHTAGQQRARPQRGGRGRRLHPREPRPALGEPPLEQPPGAQADRQARRGVRPVVVEQPAEGGEQVAAARVQVGQQVGGVRPVEAGDGGLDPLDEQVRKAVPGVVLLARVPQPLQRVLAHAGQQAEAPLVAAHGPPHEAALHELVEVAEHVLDVPDGLRLGQPELAREDAQARQQPRGAGRQQRVAPVDGGAQRALPVRQVAGAADEHPQLRSSRASSSAASSSPARAAASSRASGRPSSRRQTSATSSHVRSSRTKAGRAAWARATNSATAGDCRTCPRAAPSGGRSSGSTGCSSSPDTRRALRLVASTRSAGAAASSATTTSPAPPTCSRLSSTSRAPSRATASAVTGGCPGAPVTCRTDATAGSTPAGSSTPASGTKCTSVRPCAATRWATSTASRVLPAPPGPVSVSRRVPGRPSRSSSAAASSSRPCSAPRGAGSCTPGRSAPGGPPSEGSCARSRRPRSSSSGPGPAGRLRAARSRVSRAAARAPSRCSARASWPHEPLAAGHLVEQRLQGRDDRCVPPAGELGLVQVLRRVQAQRTEPGGGR